MLYYDTGHGEFRAVVHGRCPRARDEVRGLLLGGLLLPRRPPARALRHVAAALRGCLLSGPGLAHARLRPALLDDGGATPRVLLLQGSDYYNLMIRIQV